MIININNNEKTFSVCKIVLYERNVLVLTLKHASPIRA